MSSPAEVVSARVQNTWTANVKLKDAAAAADQTVNTNQLNPGQSSYSPTTDVPVKYHAAEEITLVAGAATIDLTDVKEAATGASIDGTGMKVQAMRIQGNAGNSGLNIAPGAANPYPLLGAANDIDYPAGCTAPFCFEFQDLLADIAAGVKEIDLAGVGMEKWKIEFLIG